LALIVELLNSAVEAAIDRISLDLHPLSKNAKDMGSAAQFIALSMIGLVWAIVLLG
ncbi:diacylglycerol kinase, partial [Pseudomonas syringae]